MRLRDIVADCTLTVNRAKRGITRNTKNELQLVWRPN